MKTPLLSRRSLALLAASSLSLAANANALAFNNPLVGPSADPFMTYSNGKYYLCCTNLQSSITILASSTLNGFHSAAAVNVYNTGGCFESPELYWFGAPYNHWYIYYTVCPNTIKVLESDSTNPQGTYHAKATLNTNSYDATLLQLPTGPLYLVGSTYGHIVIQPMSSPFATSGGQTNIAAIDQPWERTVIEAPAPVWHLGQLTMLYSSGSWNSNNYAVGGLKFNGGDPTAASSWTKLSGPLFTGDPSVSAWGAGAASTFLSADGTETWFVYQAFNSAYSGTDNRNIRAQKMQFNVDNTPDLDSPIALSQSISEPSSASYFNEAEKLSIAAQTSGITARSSGDPATSAWNAAYFDGTAAGQFITYTVPNITAGTYDVRIGVKDWNNKGQWQLAISRLDSQGSPTNVGPVIDEYTATATYKAVDLGNWTCGTTSDKAFRFTISGKNSASSAFGIAIDYVELIKQ